MPSPTLARIQRNALPQDMQAAHDHSMDIRGDATFFEVFGNHPELYRWYSDSFYGQVFRGGLVDRRIKELIRLRLSTIHGCRFCNQGNRLDALDAGLTETDINAIADYASSTLDPREKAALQLADQMLLTNPDGKLDKRLHAELSQYFSDAEILELGLVLGILSGMAKFLFAYDLVEKENNCPI
jgi:AhpD family alkylhydroperoxidase